MKSQGTPVFTSAETQFVAPAATPARSQLRTRLKRRGQATKSARCSSEAKTYVSKFGTKKKEAVFVAMSGGVDSSVAALLLKRQGYNVVGIFMRCYNIDGCAERDAEDARRVAEHIGIPFYVWDFEDEYKKRVMEYMIEGYRKGITPNPDVMCNREVKFGIFLERALSLGADYVAMGHYVRLRRTQLTIDNRQLTKNGPECQTSNVKGQMSLYVARDLNKDQSYFLWMLTQKELQYCFFPIGDYTKPQVRAIARRAKLPTAEKKDSQGICFLGNIKLSDFLKNYIPEKRGVVLNTKGEKVGEHSGAAFYTIGQRHLGVNYVTSNKQQATRGAQGDRERFYVAKKDVKKNTLVVAEGSDNPVLYRKEIKLLNCNFIRPLTSLIRANKRITNNGIKVLARVRYRQPLAHARITYQGSHRRQGFGGQARIKLIFDKPQQFVSPGQSAVIYAPIYKDFEVLGGGIIK